MAESDRTGLWFSVPYRGCFRLHDSQTLSVTFPEKFTVTYPTSLFADGNGDIWAGMGNGVVLHRKGEKWVEYNESHGVPFSFIYCMAEGSDGKLWAGSAEDGLYALQDGKFERVRGAGESIRSLFAGDNGTMWVGAESYGLTRLTRPRVTSFRVGVGTKVGSVQGLAEGLDGQIWAATWGGSVHHGPLDNLQPVDRPPEVGLYPALRACLRSRNGDLYFLGPQLLAVRDGKTGESRAITLLDANLNSICESSDQTIVLGGRDGTLRRLLGNAIVPFDGADFKSPIAALCAGNGSDIWVATAGDGLWCWDDGHKSHWTTDDGLPSNALQSLWYDDDGTLWIGTEGGGLAWLRKGTIGHLDSKRGLHNDVVAAIVEDDASNLWLGTVRGIARYAKAEIFDVAAGRATSVRPLVLDESDGMPSPECTRGYSPAGLRTRSGLLLFSTQRHIVKVDPAEVDVRSGTSRAKIESVEVDNELLLVSGPDNEQASVGPGVHGIRIEYTALSAEKPALTQFRHRLVGLQSDWVYVGMSREVSFGALPPGKYRFEVSATNPDGNWNPQAATFSLDVQPKYWQTWWFGLAAGFAIFSCGGAVVWGVARDRLQRAEHRHRLASVELQAQQQRDQLAHVVRVATLGELSSSFAHELNQPLSAILCNAQTIMRTLENDALDRHELKAAVTDIIADDRRANEITSRVRKLLKSDSLQHESVDLNAIVRDTIHLLSAEFHERSIDVQLQLAAGLPSVLGDRVQLQQVLVNLLMNAAEAMDGASRAKRSVVLYTSQLETRSQKGVLLRVSDSGSFFPFDLVEKIFEPYFTTKPDGLGLGLALCRAIVTSHGGQIWAEAEEQGGLIVYVSLPVHS